MVHNNKYIFIIGTEHQMIQVHEAIKHFNLKGEDITLFLFKVDKNPNWTDKLEQFGSINNVLKFDNWTAKDIFFNRQKISYFVSVLQKFSQEKFEYIVFTSQYFDDSSNLAYAILKPKMYYLLDEGTASFTVITKREKSYYFNLKLLIKSFFYGYYLSYPPKVIFFTQYPLNVQRFDSIEYYIFYYEDFKERIFINDEAIFLGSSLVEVSMMDEEVYLDLLKKVKADMGTRHCYYFAHRKEEGHKLSLIRNIGFEVRLNQKPFEFVFPELLNCPELICSFYSPILDTLSKKYTQIPKFIIYRFNSNLLHKDKNIAEMIFTTFATNKRITIRNI